MNQKRAYKKYLKEFKEEAVALITEQGYTVAEAAKSLGVRANATLSQARFAERRIAKKRSNQTVFHVCCS